MKIKPFKKPPAPPKDLYDRTFSLLLSATRAILQKKPLIATTPAVSNTAATTYAKRPGSPTSVAPPEGDPQQQQQPSGPPISREELYRSVEDLCVHGYSSRLYTDVCQVLETGALYCLQKLTNEQSQTWAPGAVPFQLEDVKSPATSSDFRMDRANVIFHQTFALSNDSMRILNCVREIYADYLEYLTFVRSIFLYLDRSFVLGRTNVNSLWDAGIDLFRRHAMFTPPSSDDNNRNDSQTITVIQTVISATLHQIKCEREGQVVNRDLLRSSIRMLADLPGCFTNHFIPQFLAESIAYFEAEGNRWMERSTLGTPGEFLAHVEKRWNQANEMSRYYLDYSAAKMKNNETVATFKIGSDSNLSKSVFSEKEITILLASVVEHHLLLPHVDSFLLQDKNLYPLLDDDSKLDPDLRRLNFLLSKVSKLDDLRAAFGRYGRITGIKIMQPNVNVASGASSSGNNSSSTKEAERAIIPNLLKWKERLENIHKTFLDDNNFAYSASSRSASSNPMNYNNSNDPSNSISNASSNLNVSCMRGVLEDVLNGAAIGNSKNQNADDYGRRVAELLAKHVDLCLRSAKTLAMPASSIGSSDFKPNDSDPEILLDKIMSVFRHLQSKDIFEAFFKRDLAKRLLMNRSASIDLERSFISMLKTECGAGYTSKMEGMFKDMELSRVVMSHYAHETSVERKAKEQKDESDADMEVQILTTGYWPHYQQFPNIKLPPPLLNPLSSFETHYNKQYQGRRIVWQHSLGSCIVKANFPNGTKELTLSQYQTLVLIWCFSDMDEGFSSDHEFGKGLTVAEIMSKTGIESKEECERVLQSLSLGRDGNRVLIRFDSKKNVTTEKKRIKERKVILPHDTFHFNHNFSSKMFRIKIPSLQVRETAQERDETHQSVSRDRLYLIDAALVRIMKARKTISHQALLGEVMNQLKFRATGTDIKKRIESLLERDYMERRSESRDHYNYLA